MFDGGFHLELAPHPRYETADVKWNQADLRHILQTELSAFTVAELGEMLPRALKAKGRHDSKERLYYLNPSAGGNGLRFIDYVAYENGIGTMLAAYPYIEGKTEADARAKMLIYLLENELIGGESV